MLKNMLKANKAFKNIQVQSKVNYVKTQSFCTVLDSKNFDREQFSNIPSKSLYKYKFYEKGYAFEVANPIFPLYKQSFEVSKQMFDELNQYSPIFVTSILKKPEKEKENDNDNNQQNESNQNKDEINSKIENIQDQQTIMQNITEEQIWLDFKKQKNMIEEFYPMGTYCKADFKELDEGQYKLTLTGLHRVNINSLYDVRENDLYDDERFSYGVHIHNDIRIMQDGLSSQFSLFNDIKSEMVKLLKELDELKVTDFDKQEIEYIKKIFQIYHHFYIQKMTYSQNQIILLTKQSQNLMGLNVKQSFMLKNKIFDEQFYYNAQKQLQFNILEVSGEKYENHKQYHENLIKQSQKLSDLIQSSEFPNRFKDKYLRYHSDLIKKMKQEVETIQNKTKKDEKEQTKSIFQCLKLIKQEDKLWKMDKEKIVKMKQQQEENQENQKEIEEYEIDQVLTIKHINSDFFISQELIKQIEQNENNIKEQLSKNSQNSRQERITFSQNQEEIKTYQQQMEKEKLEQKKIEEDLENKIIDNMLKQQQINRERMQIFEENEQNDTEQIEQNPKSNQILKQEDIDNEIKIIQDKIIENEQILEDLNIQEKQLNKEQELEQIKENQEEIKIYNQQQQQNQQEIDQLQEKDQNQQMNNLQQQIFDNNVFIENEQLENQEKKEKNQEQIDKEELFKKQEEQVVFVVEELKKEETQEQKKEEIKASDKRVREIKQFMRSILKSYRKVQGNYMMNEDISNLNLNIVMDGQNSEGYVKKTKNQEGLYEQKKQINIEDQEKKTEKLQEKNDDLQEEKDEQLLENNMNENNEQQYEQLQQQQDELDENLYQQESFLVVEQTAIVDCPPFQFDLSIESKLKHLLDTYSKIMYLNSTKVQLNNYNLRDGYRIIDSLGGFLVQAKAFEAPELQKAFTSIDIQSRLEKIQNLMYRYKSFLEQFQDLGKQARENIFQKKYSEYQLEMFKIAKQNVKGKSRMQAQLAKLEQNIKGKTLPEEVMEIYLREKQRFTEVSEMGQESNIILTYLEWLTSLPFGVRGTDNFDLMRSQKILDQTHYGMDDIKEKIQQFISVGKLKGNLTGKIVLLVGPPGVGKTSLAESIAKSLNKKFSRIQCGGESDSAFLKGHRKTYIGAYPGKIVQSLKECGTENCVILIDEIDKIGKGSTQGDPQANLLEILDPEQNMNFTDNYLDFKIDLSQVLFICSANTTQTISEPLLDRMDVIELSSYTHLEKKAIYNQYLYPKILKESGVEEQKELFQIPDNIVDILIKDYCREPGIRSLEKYSKKLIEKLAFQVVEKQQLKIDENNKNKQQDNQNIIQNKDESLEEIQIESVNNIEEQVEKQKEQINLQKMEKIEITEENLVKLIGFPKFAEHNLYGPKTPVGVTVGLAYTAYGGSLIFLEAITSQKKSKQPGLKATGNLGKVMKESMEIAHTFSRNFAHTYLKNDFLEENQIHLHAPEGAIPKDGPSAGITITSCLIQLVLNTPIKEGVAMTGEISLRGKIMKIGGVKEKILGAQREGINELIFPKDNEDDIQDLKAEITEGMTFHFVSEYQEAFKILFPTLKEKYF